MIHRRLLALTGPFRVGLVAGLLARVLVYALYTAQALAFAQALALLSAGHWDEAGRWLGIVVAVVGARAAAIWARQAVASQVGGVVRHRLRERLLRRLAVASPLHLRGERGYAQAAVVDGVEGLDAYVSAYLPQLIATCVVPWVLVALLARVSGWAAFVVGCCVLVAVLLPRLGDRRLMRSGVQRWKAFEDVNADFLETLRGMTTLRTFGAIGAHRQRFSGRVWELVELTVRQLRLSLLELGITTGMIELGRLAAVLIAVHGAATGHLVGREVFVVLLLTGECFRPVVDLGGAWHAGYLGLTAEPGITQVMELPPAPAQARPGPRQEPVTGPATVRLHGVSFRYAGRPADVLDDLDAELPAGALVAIVGRSGSGKSTLADLLVRHLDPDRGVVELGGVPLSQLSPHALVASTALVRQDTYLFPGSLADNIALEHLGHLDHLDPDSQASPAVDPRQGRAASAAQAAGIDWWDGAGDGPHLGENGEGLSGGQRQRVSVARALYRSPALLVLDEPTAHLDGETEEELLEELLRLRGQCTVVLIAHRPSAVRVADLVLVLDGGRIVQQGRPADLAAMAGPYRDILGVAEQDDRVATEVRP